LKPAVWSGVRLKAWLPWIVLGVILAGYVAAIVRLHPTNFFGLTEDDSIYFSSAKALAEGHGYILPSVPGNPPATKYPILYPLMLSAIWKLNPSFPANLSWAVGVTVFFGMVYLVAGLMLLRRLKTRIWEALVLTAFCAFHPVVLFHSSSVLSDIPFAALTMVAMVLADRALETKGRPWMAVLCGLLAGMSVMMRMFGAALITGILLAALARKRWPALWQIGAGVAPFVLITIWRTLHSSTIAPPVSEYWARSYGWVNAWAYYTNYLGIWKVGVPSLRIFGLIVLNNLKLLMIAPADLFLSPIVLGPSLFLRTFAALLFLLLTAKGILRQVSIGGARSVHYALPVYAALISLWNYPDEGNRFLLPFMFLLVGGAWIEIKNLFEILQHNLFSPGSNVVQRGACAGLSAAILFLFFSTILAYATKDPGKLRQLSARRGAVLPAKRQAYAYIAMQPCCPTVLAYEDVNVFLYGGRESMRPILFATSSVYDSQLFEESLAHVMDIARGINARYWIFSPDDYSVDFPKAAGSLWNCLGPAGPVEMPVVFKSDDGQVMVRSLQGGAGILKSCKGTER
jgi:4-amino-4-deoxy-L-arabinose transferase-like glycosyltransferase